MKRRFMSDRNKPGHIRAINRLLAVCDMGLGETDRSERTAFALLANVLEKTRDEWGEAGPLALTDQPEASAVAGGRP